MKDEAPDRYKFHFVVCTECGAATQEPTFIPSYELNHYPWHSEAKTLCRKCVERKHASL